MPDSYPRNTGSHREASRPEYSPSSRLHHSLNSRTTQKFYSAAASNISNPTALAFMYRVFRSFYAGGTLLCTLQLAEFSEGGKILRNEKHDHTVQISIYLHLVLVFSAAIPLTLPVAFSLSLCDHTHFFFCLTVKDLVTLLVCPFLSLLCPCPCYFGFMPWKASPRH